MIEVPTLKLTTSAISLGSIYLNKTKSHEVSPIINDNNKDRLIFFSNMFFGFEEPNIKFDSPKELDDFLSKKKLQFLDKITYREIFANKLEKNDHKNFDGDVFELIKTLETKSKTHININIGNYFKKELAKAYNNNLLLTDRMANKPEKFKKILRSKYYKEKQRKESSNIFRDKHSLAKNASKNSNLHEIKTKTNNLTKKISIKESLFANTHKKSAYNSFHNSKLSSYPHFRFFNYKY